MTWDEVTPEHHGRAALVSSRSTKTAYYGTIVCFDTDGAIPLLRVTETQTETFNPGNWWNVELK